MLASPRATKKEKKEWVSRRSEAVRLLSTHLYFDSPSLHLAKS